MFGRCLVVSLAVPRQARARRRTWLGLRRGKPWSVCIDESRRVCRTETAYTHRLRGRAQLLDDGLALG